MLSDGSPARAAGDSTVPVAGEDVVDSSFVPVNQGSRVSSLDVPDISVVTVNWNTRELVLACIESVFDTAANAKVEFILIDNNSSDGSVAAVRQTFPAVELIASNENLGLIRGNNIGIRRSRGRYVMLLNPDTVVHAGAIQGLLSFMDGNPDVAAVGPKIFYGDGTRQPSYGAEYTLTTLFMMSSGLYYLGSTLGWLRRAMKRDTKYEALYEAGWMSTACMLVRREAIETVGYMDEDYVLYCLDSDWVYRMRRAGYRVCFLPEVSITHYEGQSTKKARQVTPRNTARDVLYHDLFRMFEKFHGVGYSLLARAIVLAGKVLQACAWCAVIAFGGTQANRERARAHLKSCLRVMSVTVFGWRNQQLVEKSRG